MRQSVRVTASIPHSRRIGKINDDSSIEDCIVLMHDGTIPVLLVSYLLAVSKCSHRTTRNPSVLQGFLNASDLGFHPAYAARRMGGNAAQRSLNGKRALIGTSRLRYDEKTLSNGARRRKNPGARRSTDERNTARRPRRCFLRSLPVHRTSTGAAFLSFPVVTEANG